MRVSIDAERLLVISDLHVGNPVHQRAHVLNEFLDYCLTNNYNLCINGDGVDIVQGTLSSIARSSPELLNALDHMRKRGLRIYYVIGNHDIVLEHFLFDWRVFELVPFLNVHSGDKRIRIEHGHLYDPNFTRSPHIYEAVTWLAGLAVKVYPALYRGWTNFENRWFGVKGDELSNLDGEMATLLEAVQSILDRGFDTVILGHTHRAGWAVMDDDKRYINLGSWMVRPYYARIEDGEIELLEWRGRHAQQGGMVGGAGRPDAVVSGDGG